MRSLYSPNFSCILFMSTKVQSFIFTNLNSILCKDITIISHHQSQLDINRAVGTSRSRYRVYRRHRCRRYGVREGLLRTRLLFHRLVLAEAVASSLHSCGLDGEDKVIVVLSVEVRHKALLPDKALVEVVSKLLFCYIHIIPKQTLIMSHTAFLGEADYQNEDIIR